MGQWASKVWGKLFAKEPMRVLMLGLDAAGKTTILNTLKLGEYVITVPTVGFNVETIEYKTLSMNIWDVGGQDKIRRLWRYYYNNVDCIIFVIDSTDRERIDDSNDYENNAKEELSRLLQEDELRHVGILVYANKQDCTNCMKVDEIAQRLDLARIAKGHHWHIQGSNAIDGSGLYEGLNWMADTITPQVRSSINNNSTNNNGSYIGH